MKLTRLFQAIVMMTGVAAGCGAKVTVDSSGAAGSGAAGAGGSAGGSSCDIKTASAHVCTTFDYSTDTTGLLAAAELAACKEAGGTPGSCPTASLLGTCTQTADSVTNKETYYSDTSPAITAAQAEEACTASGGTFQ